MQEWAEIIIMIFGAEPEIASSILYGRPLVLFRTGDRKAAEQALKAAVRLSPKIAGELLKTSHRRPEAEMAGYLTTGGRAEAFEYWQGFGRFWAADALDWLRDVAAKTQIPPK